MSNEHHPNVHVHVMLVVATVSKLSLDNCAVEET